MPALANVFDHWIWAYSSKTEQPQSEDCLFWFGYEQPADILVTTCLSAHTVGVHRDPNFVGSVGARVRRFVFVNRRGNIDYKVNPPAYDWNSERISRCVSVEVRLTVFYAEAFSLNTVYVFQRKPAKPLIWSSVDRLHTRRLVAYETNSGKTVHSTKVLGVKSEVENSWREIEQSVQETSAKISGLSAKALSLMETSPRGIATSSHIDLSTGRLVRPRRSRLLVAMAEEAASQRSPTSR